MTRNLALTGHGGFAGDVFVNAKVAVAEAGPCRESAEGCREEAGGESVAGADGCDDVDGQGGDEGARRGG